MADWSNEQKYDFAGSDEKPISTGKNLWKWAFYTVGHC